ncbi:hypothetical protein IMW82_10325 [Rhodanobacter sp. B2A1Ga4]|uniref:hypothetical protein n=1 Tax=Rhodanobacter TaxID=75309 RepID=UPI000D340192|nr:MULTISPECIES: hypothetical protein [Rhodanobacter]MBQ4855064.1 hypothetical protein [Rhodanobacter sp. B2A1Ga4]
MAHGSTPHSARESSPARSWRAACRRGVILGSVTALHLLTLALVLRPALPYRAARTTGHDNGEALQLSFVARPDRPRSTNPPPRLPRPRTTRLARSAAAAQTPGAVASSQVLVTSPPANLPDGSGDYHAALAGAGNTQWAPRVRLPGSGLPPRAGILLRSGPSLRQAVRAMTTASRCKYERMKMERSANQFVTRQLVERALDADGCGPQLDRAAADGTVDAISHRAIFGN